MKHLAKVLGTILSIVIVVTLSHIAYGAAMIRLLPTWGDRASFGDMFGGLNAFFAGAAFGGILYSLVLQRRAWIDQAQNSLVQGRLLALTARLEVANSLLQMYREEEEHAEPDRRREIVRRKSIILEELDTLYARTAADVSPLTSGSGVNDHGR